jgi:hypothetical protein
MKRWLLIGVFLAVLVGLAACGGDDGDDGGDAEAAAVAPNGAGSEDEVTVELAEQNDSSESGTAVLTAMGDRTRVVLELQNPTSASQPAHIHEGECGPTLNPQPLHGLTNVMQGRSETVVDAPLSELTAGGLAINIHNSNEDFDTFVACGNLPGGGPGATSTGGVGY